MNETEKTKSNQTRLHETHEAEDQDQKTLAQHQIGRPRQQH